MTERHNPDLTDRLGFLLHDAGRLMRKRFEHHSSRYGLSSAQWRLLVRVFKEEGVAQARLAEALAKARRLHPPADTVLRQIATAGRSHFSVSERGRILLVPVPDVLYLKAEQKYVVARCADREYLLDESLVQLEEEFPERFLRIHRNCLIARHAVKGVARATTGVDGEAHWVILLDGLAEQLPVSRRQWPAVKEALGL